MVVAIFVAVGPLFGGFAIWFSFGVANLLGFGPTRYVLAQYLAVLPIFLLGGLVVGISYAPLAGIIVGVAGVWMRWNNFVVPIVAAVVANAIGAFLIMLYMPYTDKPKFGLLPWCLLATFVCWFLTRGIVRRTWPSA